MITTTAGVAMAPLTVFLATGQTVDYRVGWGSNHTYFNDSTALAATITEVSPPTEPTSYNPATDFSPLSNPNGPWIFGSTPTLGGTFTPGRRVDLAPGVATWGTGTGDNLPGVFENVTTQTQTIATTVTLAPGELVLHPGANGEKAVARFIALSAGYYEVDASFAGRDNSYGGTDTHILVNGVEAFSANVTSNAGIGMHSPLVVYLADDDTVDFVVGFGTNGTYFNDSTALNATITPVSGPPAIADNPADAFSPLSNPNDGWAFGSSPTLNGGFTPGTEFNLTPGALGWGVANNVPGAFENVTDQPQTFFSTVTLGAGELALHPGPNGEYGIARYIVPTDGTYSITGSFAGRDSSFGGTDAHILVKGVEVFGAAVTNNVGVGMSTPLTVHLNAGDTVDYRVGRGSNSYFNDATALDAVVTLVSADQPSISIGNVSQVEGNSGSTVFTFTATLSNPSSQAVSVHYTTANDTATAGSDYTATSGTLTFNPGETTKTISVTVNGNTTYEASKTFRVNLSNPTNATLATNSAVGTIINDDPQPSLLIGGVSQSEGGSGATTFSFPVTLSAASGLPTTVNFATADGTAGSSDYTSASGLLTFAPGETSKTITVSVNGDSLFEADETFSVNLSNATHATITVGQGIGTIANDDAPPVVSVGSVSQSEGNSGSTLLVFPVMLSAPSTLTTTVNYATGDGTAIAGSDYTGAAGAVTFTPGETSKSVTIAVAGDTLLEDDETFTVNLTGATGATLSPTAANATGTILNDDTSPTITIGDVSQSEGNSGLTTFSFPVTLSAASGATTTVDYATADGTATDGSDYTGVTGTVTFAPGETSKTITVNVIGDIVDESDETFTVNLSKASNATIASGTGTGTIVNDDGSRVFSINDVSAPEGTDTSTTFTFTVSLSQPSADTTTVSYATEDDTATAPDDYAATNGTLTFAPGETSQTVSVTVVGDSDFEDDETFSLVLSDPVGATISTTAGTGSGTILNDDPLPPLSIETDSHPALVGEPAEFWLPDDRNYTSIEWDLNYDGITFQPNTAAGIDTFVDATFDTVGSRTVAARVTDDTVVTTVVTLHVTVEYPPPDVTVPDDMTVTVGVPVTLQASAHSADGIESVQWSFDDFTEDYGSDYEIDPDATGLTDSGYVFEHAGEYDVQVIVTADDGQTGVGWFHVTVNDVPPPATATVTSPITEGDVATFTVHNLNPDTLDLVTIYADWYGDGTFDELTYDPATGTGDYTPNPDGSVTFNHRYTDTPNDPNDPDAAESGTYPAVIRVEDEWGLSTDYQVPVVVNNAPPNFNFSFQNPIYSYSDYPSATLAKDGVDVYYD
ncbi:MAG: hypothetical protein K8U57_14535 [Planctomycetes bacterium]|nr:hypothetical protein [Planctomycetota bacterium]